MRHSFSFLALLMGMILGSTATGLAQGASSGSAKPLGSIWTWDTADGHADSSPNAVPEKALYAWSAEGAVQAVAQGAAIQVTSRDAGPSPSIIPLTIRAADGAITAMSLDRSGKELAVATSLGFLVVWKDFRSAPAFETQVSHAAISCLAFNASGEWLATGGDSIQIWETAQWKALRPYATPASWITAIAFGSDNELVAGDFSGHIHLFHADGESTADILASSGSITALAWTLDGSLLAAGGVDGVVKIWGANRSSPLAVFNEEQSVLALSFHNNNALLAIATEGNQLSTWNIAARRRLRTLPLGNKYVAGMAFASKDLLRIGLQAAAAPRVAAMHSIVVLGGSKSDGEAVDQARADAVAIADAIQKSSGGSFGRIDQRLLLDGAIDPDKLRSTFQSVARDSAPEDSLFVYLVNPGGKDPARSPAALAFANNSAVTLAQMAHWIEDIAASHQVVVFDSSGAPSQQNALRSLLAAAPSGPRAEQRKRLFLAFDRPSSLTGVQDRAPAAAMLIDGLSGQADQYPKDGRITAAELRVFLEQRTLSIADSGFQGKYELDGDDFDLVSERLRGSPPAQSTPQSTAQSSASVFQQRHDYALIIATNNYNSWPQLTNPVQDANALRKELQDKYGFQVELLADQTQAQIYEALARYQKKSYQPGDQLLIFLAGHGDFDENAKEGFLVAKDSELASVDPTRNTFIPHSRLRNYIDNIPVNHVLLLMDVCFGGTFDRKIAESAAARGGMYEDQPIDQLFAERAQYTTRTFLTSGGKVYVPDGEPGHNSPFVHNLLAELRNPSKDRGYLTFADLQSAVESTRPAPVWGTWGKNDPGSDFFLIAHNPRHPARSEPVKPIPAPESLITQRPVVCFVGLKNLSGDLTTAVVGDEITEFVTDGLGAGDRLNVVPRQDVDEVKRSLPLENLSSYSRTTLLQIRQNTHADKVIAGSFSAARESGGLLIVSFTIQDAQRGETIDTVIVSGTQAALPELIRQSNALLLEKLGVSDLSQEQLAKATAGMPRTAKALEYYSQAMVRLHRGEASSALDLLKKADAAEPGVAMIQAGVSDAWLELGYDQNAIDAANKASSFGQGLPDQEAGALKAQASFLEGKLPEAIETYRALVMFNPDKLQFGLKLVETESKAGQGTRALDDLAMLEKLPSPLGDDPRIQIEQALTYDSVGDFPKVAEAAQKAQIASAAMGARLLEAKAGLSRCWALTNLGDNDNAVAACQHAYDIYQRVGDKLGMARAQTGLGTALAYQSDYAGALARYRVAEEITQAIGARTDRAGALQNIAKMLIYLDRTKEAVASVEAMTALAREVGDAKSEADSYFFGADLAHTGGDIAKAQEFVASALKLGESSGNQDAIARAYSFQASYGLESGSLGTALASADKCIEIRTQNQLRAEVANCLQARGDILLAQNRVPEAQAAYKLAERIYIEIKQPADAADIALSQAELRNQTGAPADAEPLARNASLEFAKGNDVVLQASALSALLDSLAGQGKRDDAEKTWNALEQLHPKDPDAQFDLMTAEARYRALLGSFDLALTRVAQARDFCKQRGHVHCELQARLLASQVCAQAGRSDGLAVELSVLAADASRLGFNLIAEQAGRLHASLPSPAAVQ